ncbi:MAG: hypothetical protein AAGA30_16540 [Planctomycetota bacterium]
MNSKTLSGQNLKTPRTLAELQVNSKANSSHLRRRQYEMFDCPQLSIFDMMILTTICGVVVTLTTKIGFFAVHIMLAICLVANNLLVRFDSPPTRFRFWNQFTWLVLLPIVCIFGDPFVFGYFEFGQVIYISPLGLACYTFIAWQILFILISWYVPSHLTSLNWFLSGTFFSATVFSGGVALLILPITLLGTLFLGMGIPGFIPWITAIVFRKSSKFHLARCDHSLVDPPKMIWWLGFFAPFILLAMTYYLAISLGWNVGNQMGGPFIP